MKHILSLLISVLPVLAIAQEWVIEETPLTTSWAEKVDFKKPLPEYPRPSMVRKNWINLNGLWQFEEANATAPIPSNRTLKSKILVPYPWESALSGIRKQLESQRAWYKRSFKIPKSWRGQKIRLNFQAVDFESIIYINGRCIGSHRGGYDAFSFDITPYLNGNEEEIIMDVRDPGNDEGIAIGKQSNKRFNNPQRYAYCPSSGIWQTVWIEPVPENNISNIKLISDIDKEQINITAFTKKPGSVIQATIYYEGEAIAKGEGSSNLPFSVTIKDPILWSTDNPFLYDIKITTKEDHKTIDEVNSYFGMRKIAIDLVDGVQKIFLNNKEIFQIGPLDQGYWPDGIYTAPTDEALRWDIIKAKQFGFNMIRKHIKIEPERWYYWCDNEGILVWQDMPSTFKNRNDEEKAQFEWELNRMIQTHWNHPSIINWIVFNEHWGLYDVERLTNYVMALDPSRLVTGNSGIDAGRPNLDFEVGHIKDNHSYRPPSVSFVSNTRATVNGEYGAIGYLVEGHVWDTNGPWVHYNYENIDSATNEYERFIKMILNFKKKGLCAAVYTQWTDVENEMNGIYTYDRKIIKFYQDRVYKANHSTYTEH